MKRALVPALVAMSVILAGLVGFLAWKKFMAAPHAAPAPHGEVAAAPAAPSAEHPTPTHAEAGQAAAAPADPHAPGPTADPHAAAPPAAAADPHATPAAAAPADPHAATAPAAATPPAEPAGAVAAAEPSHPAQAAAATPTATPPAAAHHDGHGEPAAAKPPAQTAAQREADRRHAEQAAAAAIFSDRPPTGDEPPEPSRARTGPRIPTLRPPNRAIASAGSMQAPAPQPPSRAARAPGAGRSGPLAVARAPVPAAEAALAAAIDPLPEPPAPAAGPRLPGAITGTMRDASGLPVAGASVLAVTAGGDDAIESASDDDGMYLLVGLKPGRYLLFAGLGGGSGVKLPARSVEVVSGGVARVNLREPAGGATIHVKVVGGSSADSGGQVLLVAGSSLPAASLQGLLASDAIYFPEPGSPTVLRKVPAGVYTLVYLEGAGTPPRVARQRVMVRGDLEQQIELRLPGDLAAAP